MAWPWTRRPPLLTVLRLHEVDAFVTRWLESRGLEAKTARQLVAIGAAATRLGAALDVLGTRALPNPNIPARARHAMEGNRENYVAQLRRLVARTTFSSTQAELQAETDAFLSELAATSKQIARNHAVLKEFFNDEVTACGGALRALELAVEALRTGLTDPALASAQRARALLAQHRARKAEARALAEQRRALEASLRDVGQRRAALDADAAALRASPQWQDFEACAAQAADHEAALRELDSRIHGLLGGLERPLKKLARTSPHKGLIESYVADPVRAFLADDKLGIAAVLDEMERELAGLVDPAKAPGTAAALAKAKAAGLPALQADYRESRASLDRLRRTLATHPAAASRQALDARAADLDRERKALGLQFDDLRARLAAHTPESLLQEINAALAPLGGTLA